MGVHRKYVGDPFTDVPLHARAVPTDRLHRWAVKGECLCGCETVTKITKQGLHSYFVSGHSTRVVMPQDYMTTDQFARSRRKSVLSHERHNVNCLIIGTLIKDYLKENDRTIVGLAKEIGCSTTWLGDIVRGQKRVIRRRSAVRLLRAIKEPVPEALLKPVLRPVPATGKTETRR